jgi:hypothetical protein
MADFASHVKGNLPPMHIEEEAENKLNDDDYSVEMEKIREELVAYSKGNGPFPGDANSFFEWILLNSDDDQNTDFDFVFHLDQFDLSDVALRGDEELAPSTIITDRMRLSYIRRKIAEYETSPFFQVEGVHYLPLSAECPDIHIGLLGHLGGTSIDPEYLGLFSSKTEFLDQAYKKGYFDVGIDPDAIPDEAFLSSWCRKE